MPHAAVLSRPALSRRPAPGILSRLLAWSALSRSRRGLGALDDHLLRDVGLTREQARDESARPSWETVWDAPAHWLR